MKLTLKKGLDLPEPEIEVRCRTVDPRTARILGYIRQYTFSIPGKSGDKTYDLPLEEILYADSADSHTFLYGNDTVYESRETLASLEEKLRDTSFVRISKNCILNTAWLACVSPLFNHRLEAHLKNEEKLIVSRNYIPALKEKLSC